MRCLFLLAAVILSANHPALAQTVAFDGENRILSLTAKNGRKHNFENVRQKPVRSVDGSALFFTVRTGGGFEGDGDSVFSYRLTEGSVKTMFKSLDNVDKIQPVASKKGVQGAVVTTSSSALDAPAIYVVRADKGTVWNTPKQGYAAKIIRFKGDVLKIEIYKGDFEEKTAKLYRSVTLSLEKLLR